MVFDVGINDSDYITQRNGWVCPFYRAWKDILKRCYSPKWHVFRPTYTGCEVCEEWKRFMVFRAWMLEQPWEGRHLDKDFLGDKIYGPETCVFIPHWLNNLFTDCGRARGQYPQGVTRRGDSKFRASCSQNKKTKHLGLFNSPEEDYAAYLEAKEAYVRSLYPQIEAIDPRLVPACERKLQELRSEYSPIKETR